MFKWDNEHAWERASMEPTRFRRVSVTLHTKLYHMSFLFALYQCVHQQTTWTYARDLMYRRLRTTNRRRFGNCCIQIYWCEKVLAHIHFHFQSEWPIVWRWNMYHCLEKIWYHLRPPNDSPDPAYFRISLLRFFRF